MSRPRVQPRGERSPSRFWTGWVWFRAGAGADWRRPEVKGILRSCVSWLGRGCGLCAPRPVLHGGRLRGRGGCTVQAGLSVALCVKAPRGRVTVTAFGVRTGKGSLFVHSWWTLGGVGPWVGAGCLPQIPDCVLNLCRSLCPLESSGN